MKILLTGKNGQVGFELQRALAPLGEIIAPERSDCDLADANGLRSLVADISPDVIVNAAAYTAVDRAESEPEEADAVNAVAPGVLACEARKIGALMVHYSTDYIFDGTKTGAYVESDVPNPQSVYGKSKWAGENAIRQSDCDHLIFRTSWVFGAHGGNFVKTILRLAKERASLNVVADQYGAPTSAALIADITAQILGRRRQRETADLPLGTYHLTADGVTNWHEYATAIVSAAKIAGAPLALDVDKIKAIPASSYPLPACRPKNSRLDCSRLRDAFGLRLPPWQQSLDHVLQQIL